MMSAGTQAVWSCVCQTAGHGFKGVGWDQAALTNYKERIEPREECLVTIGGQEEACLGWSQWLLLKTQRPRMEETRWQGSSFLSSCHQCPAHIKSAEFIGHQFTRRRSGKELAGRETRGTPVSQQGRNGEDAGRQGTAPPNPQSTLRTHNAALSWPAREGPARRLPATSCLQLDKPWPGSSVDPCSHLPDGCPRTPAPLGEESASGRRRHPAWISASHVLMKHWGFCVGITA
ncbi:uncharacterized protein LOC119521744 isoform X1 [Choloepus didactylus]|uniref:uncharacterized protein LOC119521744 isoform X1 n=1 Tax=Choloepus didactylus TaxID=27675 RepID=UPI0018A0E90F|nr:uncharacterized protein LOC119521744 isoform X1 [Choloepus didactylus]XP_037676291.1 uncharacterized protein LOC119521744 isoform X1 [Choloepus didactylus]